MISLSGFNVLDIPENFGRVGSYAEFMFVGQQLLPPLALHRRHVVELVGHLPEKQGTGVSES